MADVDATSVNAGPVPGHLYAEVIVARLAELKALGLPFDRAWSYAMADHPPRFTWQPTKPQLDEVSPLMFLRHQCRRAWVGEGPPVSARFMGLLRDEHAGAPGATSGSTE